MRSVLSPARLARTTSTHPWLTILAWAAFICLAALSATRLNIYDSREVLGSDSARARQLLEQRLPGSDRPGETIVVQSPDSTVESPEFEALVDGLVRDLRGLENEVAGVTSYYETHDPALVSPDEHTLLVPVVLSGELEDAMDNAKPVSRQVAADRTPGFTVLMVGDGSIPLELQRSSEKDLMTGEAVGLSAAMVILLFVFGAAVAAGLPVLLGALGILLSVGFTALVSQVSGVSSYTVNMITMIGLAVGIDYTLFVVERYREERARGQTKDEAIARAADTASRAVVFSGLTVMIAVSSLLIVPSPFFRALAVGAMTAVLSAVLIALTLLPAILGLLGDKIDRFRLPGRKARTDETGGFFARLTDGVIRHPVLACVASIAILLAAAAPYLTLRLGNPGIGDMPPTLETVQAFELLRDNFPEGRVEPVNIVVDKDQSELSVARGVQRLRETIALDPAFESQTEFQANEGQDLGLITAYLVGDTLGTDAREAIQRLRDTHVPAAFGADSDAVYVGGGTASTVDEIHTMGHFQPMVIAFVLALSFLLLTMVFRSIVIPLKAIVMNLLSVGAAYGLLVLVFQHGVGAGLLGFRQVDAIPAFIPVFLFAVLFGLSMDYHVFLISRIQERFAESGDNTAAVAHGLRTTAHIITGAAAIMLAVFSGFALGDMTELQQVGFGLAAAVFLDATVVRVVLVPASMQLLGDRNWYLPAWLEWLPAISVEGRDSSILEPPPGAAARPWPAVTGGE